MPCDRLFVRVLDSLLEFKDLLYYWLVMGMTAGQRPVGCELKGRIGFLGIGSYDQLSGLHGDEAWIFNGFLSNNDLII